MPPMCRILHSKFKATQFQKIFKGELKEDCYAKT